MPLRIVIRDRLPVKGERGLVAFIGTRFIVCELQEFKGFSFETNMPIWEAIPLSFEDEHEAK